jgi:60S ribosomal subunit assembly/export protein LOC1
MVTPVGVTKPKGKKKGKVFVDDRVRPPSASPRLFQ